MKNISDEFELFFNSLEHTGIYIVDRKNYTVYFENPTAQKYTLENRIGKACYTVHGNTSMCQSCPLRKKDKTSYVVREDLGMIFIVQAVAGIWQSKEVYIISVRKDRDIEKDLQKSPIRSSLRRMNRALTNALLNYCELNMSTDNCTVIHYINKSNQPESEIIPYKTFFELTLNKHIYEPDQKLVSTSFSIDNLHRLSEDSNGPSEKTFHFRIKDPQENIKYIETKLIILRDELPHYIIMLSTDVTEYELFKQESLIREKHQNELLKDSLICVNQANQTKTDFLASMSHDIRTPMNVIIGMTDIALNDETDHKQVHECLASIAQASDNLMHLINDILDMNKIMTGKMTFSNELFSHTKQMQQILQGVQIHSSEKHQKINLNIDITHDMCVGDKKRLTRIIENIVRNAVKFTPDYGEISISLNEIKLHNSNIGLYKYTISDTGIGMDEYTKEHIFDAFYRNDSKNNLDNEGTGLGLSIVKTMLEYVGGNIQVESTPKKGSAFILEIPIKYSENSHDEEYVPALKRMTPDDYDFSNLTILLVEDNAINQKIAKNILTKTGANVVIANNGKEAVDYFILNSSSVNAILMDVRMPIMNGYEAAKAIRSSGLAEGITVPIIAMSANAYSSDIRNSLKAGMNMHLSKPINPNQVYSAISRYVYGSK